MAEILLGATSEGKNICLLSRMGNRHGLIAGATGTGKTVTLRALAEGFSKIGVPVFTADVKGDLAGLAMSGSIDARIQERLQKIHLSGYQSRAYPVLFWDVFGKDGHALRTTVSEMGPVLLARLLDLNETQEGVLHIVFRLADEQKLLLLDLKDLKALLGWAADHASELQTQYGNVTKPTIGAIQRNLLTLEEAGGDHFFGEPGVKLEHLMQKDFSGNGVVSVLHAATLMQNPRIYSTFLLWLLSELFEQLPEVGDIDQPKLVFFFDEAHLLFDNAPKPLLEKIEQVVRLVRSKGVGVYFISQNPLDIPETVLAQLSNRVQHALRAFTEKDQKAVRASAQTFRANPAFKTEVAITELAVGEALCSTLDASGVPTPVERVWIAPPESRLGAISPEERSQIIARSPIKGIYDQTVDRESAYEVIRQRMNHQSPAASASSDAPMPTVSPMASTLGNVAKALFGGGPRRSQNPVEAMMVSAARSIGTQVGRELMRGVLGSFKGSR